MRRGETTASARRVGPLLALDEDGGPVTGEDFAGDGELEVSLDGAVFAAATGTIHEIGAGYYYYQALEAEALGALWLAVKLAGACEEFTLREDIEAAPNGIVVGEADAAKRRIGPLLALDEDGEEIEEGDLGDVTVKVSINGSAWTSGAGTLAYQDDGYLYYVLHPSEATERGWVAVKIDGACEEFTLREDIVGGPPVAEAMTPIGEVASDAELVVDVTDESGIAYVAVFATWAGLRKPDLVFRAGSFQAGYTTGSYVEEIEGGYRLHVRRDVGWPTGEVSLSYDVVDTGGNLGEES